MGLLGNIRLGICI